MFAQIVEQDTGNPARRMGASASVAGTNWQTLGAVLADDGGYIRFNDTNAFGQNERFLPAFPISGFSVLLG
jgi:hypothetical protein